MKNIIYIISLILIATSVVFVIQYPDSQRLNLIAGVLTMFGFSMNIGAFLMTSKTFNAKNI